MNKEDWMNYYKNLIAMIDVNSYEKDELSEIFKKMIDTKTDGDELPEIIAAKNDLSNRLNNLISSKKI